MTDETQRTLRFSYADGVFAAAMTGLTQDYFVPFLLFLGGTARQVGLLNALPNLFAAVVQLWAPDIVARMKCRRTAVQLFILLQGTTLLVLAVCALNGCGGAILLMALVVAFTACGAVANPAWGSWMADLVPEGRRGEYFGWRNRNLGVVTVLATFLAGALLQGSKSVNVVYGFAAVFALAFVSRMISLFFISRMHEPPLDRDPRHDFSLAEFLARLKESNFARFVIFVASLNFSVNLASPYFAVLMLRDLHFSYLLYTVINITATLTVFLLIRRWGRHADRVGNLRVIRLTAPLIGVLPLVWILSRHPVMLLVWQVVSGFLWAGFNLCTSNFIFDAVSPAKRTRCIAYFNLLNGVALCAGALIGGFLINVLPPLFGYRILTLFLISAVLRVAVGLLMPLRLKEVRPAEPVSSQQLFFSMVGMRPILGVERKMIRI